VGAFDVEAPNWGRIPPVKVTGAAAAHPDGGVTLPTDAGPLRVALLDSGVRLRLGPDARDYGIVLREPAALAVRIEVVEGGTRLVAGERVLEIGHAPLSFALTVAGRAVQSSPGDGHFVRRFRVPPFARMGDAWLVSLELGHETPVYGLGEKWGRLDRRGQLVRSYNHDALGVNAEVSYKNAPFAWSPEGWGLFVHTVAPVVHGVGYAPWSQRAYVLKVDSPSLDLFVLDGASGAQILGQYTALTGRAPVPPLWSLGLILSKAYYRTAEEILAVAREVRERGMPCDTITFDGRAWQDTDTRFAFEWDPARYPDPRSVIEQLKELDFRICVWEYPLISVRNPLFEELAAKGWLLKDARTGEAYRYQWDLEPFGAVLTPLPESGLLDFTQPDAYAYWRDRHRELFELGVDMIKPDFGEQVEPYMVASDGAQGDDLHNVYALLYNRCVYEAASRYSEGGRSCSVGPPGRARSVTPRSGAVTRRPTGAASRRASAAACRGASPARRSMRRTWVASTATGAIRCCTCAGRRRPCSPPTCAFTALAPASPGPTARRRNGPPRRRSSCATACCRTCGERSRRRVRPDFRYSAPWRWPARTSPRPGPSTTSSSAARTCSSRLASTRPGACASISRTAIGAASRTAMHSRADARTSSCWRSTNWPCLRGAAPRFRSGPPCPTPASSARYPWWPRCGAPPE